MFLENLTITKVSSENALITCPIEESENRTPLHLRKLIITPEMKLTKCYLGFENEQRMFANQNVQNLLKFCQFNGDNFIRSIELEYIARDLTKTDTNLTSNGNGLKILRPLNFTKFLHRNHERNQSNHEKEDSIIFLSKNDLENLEIQQKQQEQLNSQNTSPTTLQSQSALSTITDKMKVFQPTTKKKWFKNFNKTSSTNGNKANTFNSGDINSKRKSMDRYQDMSKLLQERFGGNVVEDLQQQQQQEQELEQENSIEQNRSNSDIGYDDIPSPRGGGGGMQKSMSLQDVDIKSNPIANQPLSLITTTTSNQTNGERVSLNKTKIPDKPDLLKIIKSSNIHNGYDDEIHSFADNDDDHESSVNQQQSFISQKLYSEFHVKTRQHSKSSSSLHQLLHFTVPQKMTINETVKSHTVDPIETNELNISKFLEQSNESSNLTFEDELPYSNVRDSLLMNENDSYTNTDNFHTENIYAEICQDNSLINNRHNMNEVSVVSTSSPITHHNNHNSIGNITGSIRISISNDQFNAGATNNNSTILIKHDDNIYNTIK